MTRPRRTAREWIATVLVLLLFVGVIVLGMYLARPFVLS